MNNIPAKSNIEGITEDIVTGPKGIWTLREAYNPTNPKELNVGNLWVWTNRTTWNPVGGFGDVYSNDIWNNVRDTAITTHPFNGKPIPFRASYDVETAGPDNNLSLPADAFLWDVIENRWATVTDPQKIKNQLLEYELIAEDLSGDTLMVEISAKTKLNFL